MAEVIGVRFKEVGKVYYFDPLDNKLSTGDKVIVETARGLECGEVAMPNKDIDEKELNHPLKPLVRIATKDDLRRVEENRKKEKSAHKICEEKIAKHKLVMKLVNVEYTFDNSKIIFYFTADGRVDFRALVKDLAAILHNRIELRQIGVRDEAKMLGGLGICGRPYCCNLFMDDFHPVSTKMAKVQSLSLNPAKISGSCGRLMCCLRYEQEAYEDLVKKVPKQGAFVETKDGYGTAVTVNLLRSTVKVKLDEDRDDVLHEYKDYELTAVPGGRPKDGSAPPHVLEYVEPETPPADEPEDEWAIPELAEEPSEIPPVEEALPAAAEGSQRSRRSRSRKKPAKAAGNSAPAAAEKSLKVSAGKERTAPGKSGAAGEPAKQADSAAAPEKRRSRNRRRKISAQKVQAVLEGKTADSGKQAGNAGSKPQKVQVQQSSGTHADGSEPKKQGRSRRRPFRGKPAKKPSQDS